MEFDQIKKKILVAIDTADIYREWQKPRFVILHHDEYKQVYNNATDRYVSENVDESGCVVELFFKGLKIIRTFDIAPGEVIVV